MAKTTKTKARTKSKKADKKKSAAQNKTPKTTKIKAKLAAKKTGKKSKAEEDVTAKAKKRTSTKSSGKKTKDVGESSAAVHTKSRTDKSKMPSILTSKAYLDLVGHMDNIQKKLNIPHVNLEIGGHIKNAISTGVLSFDFVHGGGYAGGRFHVLPGLEQSGKSSIIVTSIANATDQNVPSLYADAESAIDAGYADRAMGRFGYTMNKMLGIYDEKKGLWLEPPMVRLQQVNNGEKVFRMIRRTMSIMPDIRKDSDGKYWAVTQKLNKDGSVKSESAIEHDGAPQYMFFIDSIASLIPNILDTDDEKATIGAHALMMSRMLPQVCSLITRKNCILVASNQLRTKIGGFTRPGMPPPTTMPGGEATRFYSEIRTTMSKSSASSAGWAASDSEGYVEEPSVFGGLDRYDFVKFKNVKHKAFIPKRSGFARIRFMHRSRPGDGYDASFDVFTFLRATGQLTKRGTTLSLDIQPTKENGKNPVLPVDPHAKKVSWMDFKRAVELPEYKKAMFHHCRAQIKSGYAFDLERERMVDSKAIGDDAGEGNGAE